MADSKEFDGFYILPGDKDGDLQLSYFDFVDDFDRGDKIEHTEMGDKYHVIFLRKGQDNVPELEDHFEAIFSHPETYVRNLVGANVYGCFVRKTENSWKWVDDYLKRTLARVTLLKLKYFAKSIAERK